ncbi:MAG: adenylosuccinate synthetase, partial [Proteobacteria bacterium]|nr:adenylosuccinate synthetase [Pseudomonadota bacterium]
AITKLDVLDDLDEIKICTGYEFQGKIIHDFPAEIKVLAQCTPEYEVHPGWKQNTSKIKEYEALPENAKKYLDRIVALTDVSIKIVSVGPGREATILKESIF